MFEEDITGGSYWTVFHTLQHHPVRNLLTFLDTFLFLFILPLLFGIFLDIAIHVNSVGPLEEIKEGELSHIVVIILSNCSKFFKDRFEFIHLFQDIDVTGMDVKYKFLGFVHV